MNINDQYLLVGYLSRELGSGMFGPDRFNKYCDLVNIKYFKRYLGLPEEWEIGTPMAKITYQVAQGVSERIDNFIVPDLAIPRTNGFFPKPAGFVAFSSMSILQTMSRSCATGTQAIPRNVKIMPDAEFKDRLESISKGATLSRPIGRWTSKGWDVQPSVIDPVLLTYLRMPVTPFRAYTGTDAYDPANSVQFEFPDICGPDILAMLLDAAGLGVQDAEVIAAARRIIKEGI